jgi:hypothetical protein
LILKQDIFLFYGIYLKGMRMLISLQKPILTERTGIGSPLKTPLNISRLRSMAILGLLLITGGNLKMNRAGIESISRLKSKERK